uniref:SCP domain-containing protein n=1 Tax=Panagrellus redivivus TaxID=6233 RepID=A0A7E4URD1_PANRE
MTPALRNHMTHWAHSSVALSPVKCSNETGNDLSEAQRGHIIYMVNKFRSIINNSKRRRKRAVSKYRKVKYSCVFEAEAKFECDADLSPGNFKSNEYTWRRAEKTEQMTDPFNNSMRNAYNEKDTFHMTLSTDVTEIGCFDKSCNGYEYIACKTGYAIVPAVDTPLYTPNSRCKVDADCTVPGYTQCDTALGLCDWDPPDKKVVSPTVCLSLSSPRIPLFEEKCDGVYKTGIPVL